MESELDMLDQKCIYCLRDVPDGDFTTEHVLSKAFGIFKKNLTLPDMVCSTCSQFFGDHIERVVARDSIEALHRIQHRVKPVEEIYNMPENRLTFTAALPGEWDGLRLALVAEDGDAVVTPVPQVGLPRREDTGWIFLIESELTDLQRPLPDDFDRQGDISVIGPTHEIQQRLIGLLRERGVHFHEKGDFALPRPESDQIAVYVRTKIDPVVKRCIAKYAFNYLAYVMGREFALLPDFDATRAYIRHDVFPGYPVVLADDVPILRTDTRVRRQTNGHLLTLNWTRDRRHIVAQVSLFNHIRYRVTLARGFSGLWRPICSGHHFDLEKHQVSSLVATSLKVPIPMARPLPFLFCNVQAD